MITSIDVNLDIAYKLIQTYLNSHKESKILDVGGGIKPLSLATHVIDILPYSGGNSNANVMDELYPDFKFHEDTWLVRDICDTPWPYEDKQFDIVWCTQTLEDIRDPIGVVKEMTRIGKQGYISSIHRSYESQLNIDNQKGYAGFVHHRWFVEIIDNELIFTFKYPLIHVVNEYRPLKVIQPYIGLWWENELNAKELHLRNILEIQEYFSKYVKEL